MQCPPASLAVRLGLAAVLSGALVAASARALPPAVEHILQRARVPDSALSVEVRELGSDRTLLQAHALRPVNPASVTKLLTTMAALDRLGPAWTWATPVWLQGPVKGGVLHGSLFIKGSGDPQLVIERLWLLLRRVQAAGVHTIEGDIVLDRSAFDLPSADAADFDGEATRPYNVLPNALLLNFESVNYRFVPDAGAGVAQVLVEPALADTPVDHSVALAHDACNDWKATLKASFGEQVHFAGAYPAACGEQAWDVADARPASYDARLLRALWMQMGGELTGRVREGAAPAGAPSFELPSPPLAEVVRDINKFSNNVMAQQLFYTLDLQQHPALPATTAGARAVLRDWLAAKLGADFARYADDLVIDNGSGLSRRTRLSVRMLVRLLTLAYASPVMPELMASLPVLGTDGSLRRWQATAGRAHLKTGSLRDVAAVAGYVLSNGGRRYVLAAVIEHANASAARPALDALVQWLIDDAPPS